AESSPSERGNARRVGVEMTERLAPAEEAALLAGWANEPALQGDAELGAAHARAVRRAALRQGDLEALSVGEDHPAGALSQFADRLAEGPAVDGAGRAPPRGLVRDRHHRGLALALLLYDAALRNDPTAVAEQLGAVDGWRGLRPAPPRFVLRALAAVVAAHPTHVAWRQSLGRWLQLWPLAQLGSEGATLAA